MPTPIRAGLSLLVAALAVAAFLLEGGGGQRWFALLLGALLLGAVWLFPEARAADKRR